jgi:hypothetical protein
VRLATSASFSGLIDGYQGYLLLGMLSSLVFRAIRDALPGNPAAQERIIGASLLAMALADVSYHRHDDEVSRVELCLINTS